MTRRSRHINPKAVPSILLRTGLGKMRKRCRTSCERRRKVEKAQVWVAWAVLVIHGETVPLGRCGGLTDGEWLILYYEYEK
jgi:hypothetical protein